MKTRIKSLSHTWILQAFLFLIGFTASWRQSGKLEVLGGLLDGFATVWTDSLVVALVGYLLSITLRKRSPKAGLWWSKVALSCVAWFVVGLMGYLLAFIAILLSASFA